MQSELTLRSHPRMGDGGHYTSDQIVIKNEGMESPVVPGDRHVAPEALQQNETKPGFAPNALLLNAGMKRVHGGDQSRLPCRSAGLQAHHMMRKKRARSGMRRETYLCPGIGRCAPG